MSTATDLLCVWAVVVFVVDVSGFTDTLLGWASRFTRRYGLPPVRSLRPFTCSLCMTWWCCLVYALVTRQLTLPVVAFTALLAGLSKTLAALFIFIRESTAYLVGKLIDLCTRY